MNMNYQSPETSILEVMPTSIICVSVVTTPTDGMTSEAPSRNYRPLK